MRTLINVVLFVLVLVLFGSVVPADAQPEGRWFSSGPRVDDFTRGTSYAARQRNSAVSVAIGCSVGDTTYVAFVFGGVSLDGTVQYRLDGADIRSIRFTMDDPDHEILAYAVGSGREDVISLEDDRAIAFLGDIGDGREMRVRIRTRIGIAAQTINLEGMAEHVSEVRRYCDW